MGGEDNLILHLKDGKMMQIEKNHQVVQMSDFFTTVWDQGRFNKQQTKDLHYPLSQE